MAALRCLLCGVSYPKVQQFAVCPLHGEETSLVKADPDPDWKEQLTRLKAQADKAAEIARPVPRVQGVEPYTEHGLLWVDQRMLMDAGFRISRIASSFRLFELEDGFVYETQGWDEPNRRWWVERVLDAA